MSDFFDILINFLQSFTPMPLWRSDNEESIKDFPFDVRRSATLRQRDKRSNESQADSREFRAAIFSHRSTLTFQYLIEPAFISQKRLMYADVEKIFAEKYIKLAWNYAEM